MTPSSEEKASLLGHVVWYENKSLDQQIIYSIMGSEVGPSGIIKDFPLRSPKLKRPTRVSLVTVLTDP